MMQAAITITNGALFPGERERVYRLRAGKKGTGKILHAHRARGSRVADDVALISCRERAEQLGYGWDISVVRDNDDLPL